MQLHAGKAAGLTLKQLAQHDLRSYAAAVSLRLSSNIFITGKLSCQVLEARDAISCWEVSWFYTEAACTT